ncbi:MAG TPA: SRPBCC domain-containing protein [Chryseolinea sp.]|nr:SRPBCC domain-containing protein [Chryseolinea sp.]
METKKEVKVTRVYNAPVELVWQTWTDPELVMRWWGPDRFTCPSAKIDFREGGTSIVSMKAPKAMGETEWYNIWHYKKIVTLKSIEYIQNFADKDGNKVPPTKAGMPPDFPENIRTVVIFKKLGANQTEMTVTEYADMGQTAEFAKLGLEQCLDKMGRIFDREA